MTKTDDRDHVDAFLESIHLVLPDLDLEVEGIVDRISGLARRLQRSMDETLAEFGLDTAENKVLSILAQGGEPFRSTPGRLAARMELSSGAMTNRLDRLEQAGLVQRLPDPDDRRSVVVELTDHGRKTYRRAVGAQANKEALVTAALNEREKVQLNSLLRLMMLEFERRERGEPELAISAVRRCSERARRPQDRGQHHAQHRHHQADHPGGDVLRAHDRSRGDADSDHAAGCDKPDEDRFDTTPPAPTPADERNGRRIEVTGVRRIGRLGRDLTDARR